MQIHDLNTKELTDPAYVAFDDGTDTYKVEFNDTVERAAQAAVAEADLTQNTVGFTSGDSLSPSGWTSVSQITTDSTLATLFNRISTMVKNVRYIWNLLGSSSFSNVASTLTGAIGNTALTTTAQTLSGAIAEHESDISTLNSKIGQLYLEAFSISSGSAKELTIYSGYRGALICFDSGTTGCGIYFLLADSRGVTSIKIVSEANRVTITSGSVNNKITISVNSGTIQCLAINYYGGKISS